MTNLLLRVSHLPERPRKGEDDAWEACPAAHINEPQRPAINRLWCMRIQRGEQRQGVVDVLLYCIVPVSDSYRAALPMLNANSAGHWCMTTDANGAHVACTCQIRVPVVLQHSVQKLEHPVMLRRADQCQGILLSGGSPAAQGAQAAEHPVQWSGAWSATVRFAW